MVKKNKKKKMIKKIYTKNNIEGIYLASPPGLSKIIIIFFAYSF
jgi:hypothetical protein